MIEAITNLISDYVENNKTLDNKFITEILDILLKEYDVSDLSLNNNVYYRRANNIFSSGFPMDYEYPKGINVHIPDVDESIIKTISFIIPMVKGKFSHLNDLKMLQGIKYYYYIKTIMTLRHEVEHVIQNKNYGLNRNLEEILITLNLRLLHESFNSDENLKRLYNYKKLDKNIYYIEPIERFANIKSTDIIESIICSLDLSEEIKALLLYILKVDKSLLYTYSYFKDDNSIIPIYSYINYMKSLNEYYIENIDGKDLDNYIESYGKDLSFKERLYYGYKISDSEFNDIKTLKLEIK